MGMSGRREALWLSQAGDIIENYLLGYSHPNFEKVKNNLSKPIK